MNPRQDRLLQITESLLAKTAAKKKPKNAEKPKRGGTNLWKYTCPETEKDFYLTEKKTTVRSPYTGKNFSAKPEKDTLSEVGKELKQDAAAAKNQSKKASLLSILRGDHDLESL